MTNLSNRAHNGNVTETYNISYSNYQLYRYYRIVATAVQSATRLRVGEWTLFGVTQAQTTTAVNFTSTSNLIVDYMKHHSTTARRLQNADGDEIDSFEVTNGVLSNDQEKPTITIDDNRYDASEAPDSVKQYISDLTNSCRQKNNLEFRLRQLDAAKNAYFTAVKDEIQTSGISPMDPQPEKESEGTG